MLKKPSQLFREQKESDNISFDPESKAYQSFKHNVDKINSLSNFNETIENYRNSVDNVNNLSEEIEEIRNDIKKLLTAEDLDRAMMGQFVMIDETIAGVQDKVKSINESKLKEIRSDVNEITTSVNEFLEVEAPKYNKLLFDHQRTVDRKYTKFEEKINKAFNSAVEEIAEVINDIHSKVTSTVDEQITGINQDNLESIIEDVKALGEKQEGKYKKIIVNSELRIDNRYHKFEETVNSRCDDLSSIISQLTEQVSSVEGDNSDIVKTLNDKISNLTEIQESVASVKEEIEQQQTFLSDYAKEISQDVDSLKADVARSEKHIKDQDLRVEEYGQFKEKVENKVEEYQNVISEQQKQNEDFQKSIKTYKGDINKNIKNVVARVDDQQTYNEHWQEKVDKTVKEQEEITEKFKKDIDDKVESLEKGFGVNEEIVKKLEKEFSLNKEIVKEAVTKLDIDGIEKKNFELSNKIKYLEEVFEKFSDKAVLTESLITEPPSTKNSDPLTPLDQNFVTLDQLNKHYSLFLNRIQQQLSTLGGGGEVRLEFLDDIDRSSAKVNGKFLKYNSATGKWEGATGGGGGDTNEIRDAIQGFYGYTTDFYTVGTANTSQEVGAGVTTLIMPQVASDGINQHLPTVMTDVNNGDPWIGSGAPIGTGQTQFSLAGIGSGASCIVRTALQFDPDIDHTNLDVLLRFTTNTGSSFDIKKEQALIMNEGADQPYISETLFSFFVGTTLEGTTKDNAGSFNIQVIPSDDGVLEVLAVTVNVVA